MKHGDLSNQRSFAFGFRCENSLLTYQDKGVLNKIGNTFVGRTRRAVINPEVVSFMKYIYYQTEYTVMLVIDKENYTEEAQEVLNELPFSYVATVLESINEVSMMLHTGEMTYYVDNCDKTRNLVSPSEYAINTKQLDAILKRKGHLT